MQLFYDPDLQEGVHHLAEEEARHAIRVLRKRVGDELDLVDGRGGWFRGRVVNINKRECVLDVKLLRREDRRAGHALTLMVAPTKSIDRFEWILEKATEIGVDHIQPMITEHSERQRLRADRLERVLQSAMKQSLRAWLPTLGELIDWEEALGEAVSGDRYLAYLGDEEAPLLSAAVRPGHDCVVAIGPEGGFSAEEAAAARDRDFRYVSLGPHRLRTETAALAAVHTVESANWGIIQPPS
ncbi:16S rRNA (uracil1498-N3)-methyltransferase [Lewinella marina]|uniref:Ribosomal RNA small subunit methyltransferase E n=1 Tax=Neolewinella marina TaxID=438751 RepID=A0A2G0CI53_9BACT|nr:RsmE family RNA methyltransferase [Neolewinella marina]NJB85205.1 16S rRNA (uracil1498-N3)-methyltransferase [Neolewinella marina]PHK99662.1 16S rRNA (uracil(1498)-N(3))-methyltransferase [Neolewinella marina]